MRLHKYQTKWKWNY